MTAKLKIRQNVIFIEPRKFEPLDILKVFNGTGKITPSSSQQRAI